jgi:hypothetical protein
MFHCLFYLRLVKFVKSFYIFMDSTSHSEWEFIGAAGIGAARPSGRFQVFLAYPLHGR